LGKIKLQLKKGANEMEKKKHQQTSQKEHKEYRKDAPGATSGINTPGIELPSFNPPVPNRAWTAMKMGVDISELTEEEKRDLYYGHDGLI
jgi:hypothetical protein